MTRPSDAAHIARRERVAIIQLDRGIRMHPAERDDVFGVVAAFLAHLAPRREERTRVFGIDHSARNLQCEIADAVTELPHHHNLAGGRDRNDVDPGRRLEHEKLVLAAMRMRALMTMEVEDGRRIDALAAERLPASGPRARHRSAAPPRPLRGAGCFFRTGGHIQPPDNGPSPPSFRPPWRARRI